MNELTKQARDYGYNWRGMRIISLEEALLSDQQVWLLYNDNTEATAEDSVDMSLHVQDGGFLGIEYSQKEMDDNAKRERVLVFPVEKLIQVYYADINRLNDEYGSDWMDEEYATLEILRKHIPKHPVDGKCPTCGSVEINLTIESQQDFGLPFTYDFKFCQNCGQELDHSINLDELKTFELNQGGV